MASSRPVSMFDVIGPIMVGPSSSHTAGAVRLGQIGRAVLGAQPTKALIELCGSFAQTGKGHGTHLAIVAGLLGLSTDNETIRDSFQLAEERGLNFEFQLTDCENDSEAHPNTARLTLWNGRRQVKLTGVSVGGGMVKITNLQGHEVHFGGDNHTLLVIARDRPGTVNAITGWLLKHNINVAFLRVERGRRGGEAIMTIETDEAIPPDLVEAIEDFDWVYWVRPIDKAVD